MGQTTEESGFQKQRKKYAQSDFEQLVYSKFNRKDDWRVTRTLKYKTDANSKDDRQRAKDCLATLLAHPTQPTFWEGRQMGSSEQNEVEVECDLYLKFREGTPIKADDFMGQNISDRSFVLMPAASSMNWQDIDLAGGSMRMEVCATSTHLPHKLFQLARSAICLDPNSSNLKLTVLYLNGSWSSTAERIAFVQNRFRAHQELQELQPFANVPCVIIWKDRHSVAEILHSMAHDNRRSFITVYVMMAVGLMALIALHYNQMALAVKVDTLGAKMDALGGDMTGMQTKVDTLGGNMTGMQTKMDTLGGNMTGMQTKMDALGEDMTGMQTKVDALGGNMTGMQTKMDAIEEILTMHQQQMTAMTAMQQEQMIVTTAMQQQMTAMMDVFEKPLRSRYYPWRLSLRKVLHRWPLKPTQN